jgi:hypothetical protein
MCFSPPPWKNQFDWHSSCITHFVLPPSPTIEIYHLSDPITVPSSRYLCHRTIVEVSVLTNGKPAGSTLAVRRVSIDSFWSRRQDQKSSREKYHRTIVEVSVLTNGKPAGSTLVVRRVSIHSFRSRRQPKKQLKTKLCAVEKEWEFWCQLRIFWDLVLRPSDLWQRLLKTKDRITVVFYVSNQVAQSFAGWDTMDPWSLLLAPCLNINDVLHLRDDVEKMWADWFAQWIQNQVDWVVLFFT